MRVVIVSTPRTCSSFLGNIVSKKYNLQDHSEIFSYGVTSNEKGLEKLKVITDTDNFSVKITSTSFFSHKDIMNPDTFPWELFDKIILAEREDIAQQVASWMLLNYAQLHGHLEHSDMVDYLNKELLNVECIPFREHEFEHAMESINYFYTVLKPTINNFGQKVKVVKYELLQKDPSSYIEELNSILDTDFSVEDVSQSKNKTELDYTPFIDYYKLREKIYATKEENNTTEQPIESKGIV